MDAKKIITTIMKEKGISQLMLARMIGFRGQSNVSEALKRDMRISVFAKMLDALGYEVVVRKKSSGRKGDGVYVLEVDEK